MPPDSSFRQRSPSAQQSQPFQACSKNSPLDALQGASALHKQRGGSSELSPPHAPQRATQRLKEDVGTSGLHRHRAGYKRHRRSRAIDSANGVALTPPAQQTALS